MKVEWTIALTALLLSLVVSYQFSKHAPCRICGRRVLTSVRGECAECAALVGKAME